MIYKVPISVLVVIHTLDRQYLLLERTPQPGFWQSVTGSIEENETLLDCAHREVQEETGIKTSMGRWVDLNHQETYTIWKEWRHRYAPGVTQNTEHWFSCAIAQKPSITLQPSEHSAHGWFSAYEAAERCFSPSNQSAIFHVEKHIQS